MPKLLTTPFASEATSEYRTDVQNATGAEPNSATYEQGFPPVTMEKIANGGKPPKGSDLNGVLYDITDNLVSLTKGARYGFNEAYATAIGGYPLGAVLRLENGVEVESEVDSNSINPNVDMAGWKLAVSDNSIVTWSGRTQRENNKDFITPLDFKAKGNAGDNDTQAFINLEVLYNNQVIDLLGKTYKVDRDFTKNKYVNGSFRIVNSNRGKGLVTASSSKYQSAVGNGQKIGEVICPLTDDTVSTSSTIVQSAYYSQVENRLYTHRSILETATDEMCIIEAFDYANISVTAPPIFTSEPLNFVGHQGLGVQRNNGNKFWATASKTTKGADKARYVVRFELNTTTGEASNIAYFKVFGDEFASSLSGANTMSISPNGQFLIVTGNHTTKGRYVRVFGTSIMTTEGDYSDKYLYEFGFQYFNGFNPQSICCDNEFIYILHGGTTGTEKVEIYTLDGAFIDLDDNFAVGSYDATLLPYYYYEPESLFIGDNGRLLCSIATGKKAGVDVRGPYTNLINDVLFTPTRVRKTDGDRPLYFLDASRTYAHSPSRALSYWTVASTGTYSAYKTQNKTATVYTTQSNESFLHRLNCNGTGQPQYRVTNSLGDGMLQVSSGGGFGLYDIKTGKWVIVSSGSKSQIAQQLQLNTIVVYADNTTAKAGGLSVGDVYRTSTGQLMIVY